ncbi:MAG TPA: response regulator [Bryobacteraceae bacterium]|nr:response regulator [Bryobacteraceae bacterium]
MSNLIALYVEDDDSTFFLVQTALSETSLPVDLFRAADGDEALDFLKKTGVHRAAPRPDMVLLDLNLPRVSGFEVLESVQSSDTLQNLPICVLSTSAVVRDRERALQLGARDFFTKPSTFDGLVDLMRSIFGPALANSLPAE